MEPGKVPNSATEYIVQVSDSSPPQHTYLPHYLFQFLLSLISEEELEETFAYKDWYQLTSKQNFVYQSKELEGIYTKISQNIKALKHWLRHWVENLFTLFLMRSLKTFWIATPWLPARDCLQRGWNYEIKYKQQAWLMSRVFQDSFLALCYNRLYCYCICISLSTQRIPVLTRKKVKIKVMESNN